MASQEALPLLLLLELAVGEFHKTPSMPVLEERRERSSRGILMGEGRCCCCCCVCCSLFWCLSMSRDRVEVPRLSSLMIMSSSACNARHFTHHKPKPGQYSAAARSTCSRACSSSHVRDISITGRRASGITHAQAALAHLRCATSR